MSFGAPFGFGVPFIVGLFDTYPIGARITIGVDSGYWVGHFGGIQCCVAVLTDAKLFSNVGSPASECRPVVRIPIRAITFVSQ